MDLIKMFSLGILILASTISTLSQIQDWRKLIPLKSDRKEVEKIFGKPEKYFESSGTYQTITGRLHVWYSSGGCRKNIQGLQWNVPARKLTRILLYTGQALPLEAYITNKEEYKKDKSPDLSNIRYLYTSPDESIIYETINSKDYGEFVYTIELQPSKNKSHLLCKKNK